MCYRFKKFAVLLLAALLIYPASALAADKNIPKVAPVSPEFQKWLENQKNNETQSQVAASSISRRKSGVIPDPVKWPGFNSSQTSGNNIVQISASLPSKYDLRTQKRLTSIKSQGNYGTCWAFSTIASMESTYKKKYSSENPDLSEMFIAYFVYGDTRSGKYFYYTGELMDNGANASMATALLARTGLGTVNESTLPYPSGNKYTKPNKLPENYQRNNIILREMLSFGDINSASARNVIKNNVINNGAVYVAYHIAGNEEPYKSSKLSTNDFVFYTTTQEGWHASSIVGWDDNFSRLNFNANSRPKSNGAWLIRNTWGEYNGSTGYFWMPYEQPLYDATVMITEKYSGTLRTYGHADLGITGWVGYKWNADIFKAEATESLRYAGFYTIENNDNYELYVYDLGTSIPSSPRAGTLILKATGTVPYSGYHTVDLSSYSKTLTKGRYYSIVMKMKASIALEMSIAYYAYPVSNYRESYCSGDGTTWYDTKSFYQANSCMNLFTAKSSSPSNNNSSNSLSSTQKLAVSSKVPTTGSIGTSYSAQVNASGGTSPYTFTRTGTLPNGLKLTSSGAAAKISGKPTKAGKFSFKITVKDSAKASLTKSFTVNITEAKPAFEDADFSAGNVSQQYTSTVKVINGTSPYKFAKTSGTVPAGLKLTYSGANLKLSGKPTKTGTYKFAVKVTDKNNLTATKTFNVKIFKLEITGTLANGTVNKTYSSTLTVKGGTASYKCSKSSGTLPNGLKLTLSGARAKLAGKPTKAGKFTFTIKFTDKNNLTVSKKFTVQINAATAKTSGFSQEGMRVMTAARVAVTNKNSEKINLALIDEDNIISRGEDRDDDLFTVKAGEALTFEIRGLRVDDADIVVLYDFKELEDVIINDDGTFTIPAELVTGDFAVSVRAESENYYAESDELYFETE